MADNNKSKLQLKPDTIAIIAMNIAYLVFAVCFSAGAWIKSGSTLLGIGLFCIFIFGYALLWLAIIREW